jgi:circadian clock protein KaiC
MYRSPVDIYLDEWVYELLETVQRTGATRVLIDSLSDLKLAATDEKRFQEFAYSLVQRFSRQGVSVLMTLETANLFHAERLSDSATSHLSDNVVLLGYIQQESMINRTITVIKSRATKHRPRISQFTIGDAGIVLTDTPPSASPPIE